MESNVNGFSIRVSGNVAADCTLFIADFLNLFTGTFQSVEDSFSSCYRIISYTDSGFDNLVVNRALRYDSIDGYADEIIGWLENNNVHNVIFLAHSINGLIALAAAAKAPHLFEKLIFTSVVPCLQNDPASQYLCGFDGTKKDDIFRELVSQNYVREEAPVNAPVQLADILGAAFRSMSEREAKAVFDLLLSIDTRKLLEKVTVSTMILQVLADKISTQEAGYYMYRSIPNSQFVKIRAKGHLPQVSAPEEIVTAMNVFMDSSVC